MMEAMCLKTSGVFVHCAQRVESGAGLDQTFWLEFFMQLLIVNADDFGWDEDVNDATIALLELGAIRSATLLVGYGGWERAARYARDNQGEISFGLHLNIAEGRPLSGRGSLVGRSGDYRSPALQRLHALFHLIRPEDVAAEAEEQLSILADAGIRPSHVDSHGHLHKFPAIIGALRPVLARHGITKVRRPPSRYDRPTLYNRLLDGHCARAFGGLTTTDTFFNTHRWDRKDWLGDFIAGLQTGSVELGIHPGHREDWRSAETRPFESGQSREIFARHGIMLGSYHDLK